MIKSDEGVWGEAALTEKKSTETGFKEDVTFSFRFLLLSSFLFIAVPSFVILQV